MQESWVEAVQVYNVFGLFPDLLEELNTTMAKNIEHRATVVRGKLRHNDGEGVMVGEGQILDQHGNVGPWHNMGPLLDSVKYVIEEESADVLDICVKVVTLSEGVCLLTIDCGNSVPVFDSVLETEWD